MTYGLVAITRQSRRIANSDEWMEKTLHCGVNAYGNANKANGWE
ncbi:hypothetical protein [Haemophilus parainfluenzae]|nr:hypothetical protein [Haemophilus parainfluenzae]